MHNLGTIGAASSGGQHVNAAGGTGCCSPQGREARQLKGNIWGSTRLRRADTAPQQGLVLILS